MYKQSLHVHSTFCDGADTPEEMIRTALEKGFDSVGFSGHSSMASKPGRVEAYKAEIRRLAAQYRDQIPVWCGLEWDLCSDAALEGYDYLIGTVHYLRKEGRVLGFDRNWETVRDLVEQEFDGDGLAFAKLYWESLATLPAHGNFDILGHADILCKHGERPDFVFDRADPRYRAMAREALRALAGKIPLFEVNTGAIARGYRTQPYPGAAMLRRIAECGGRIIFTSDCHNSDYLDCAFGEAAQLARACGFKSAWEYRGNEAVEYKL